MRHQGSIRLAIFSGDGKRLLSLAILGADTLKAPAKREVRVWDLTAKRSMLLHVQLLEESEAITDAACNYDGSRVLVRISGSRFGTENRVVLCEAATGQPCKLPGEGANLERALFSADGRRLFTLHRGGRAEIRDAMTGALVSTLGDVPGTLQAVALTPDGRYCLTASERAIIAWDAVTGLAATPVGGIKIDGKCVAAWMSSDGRLVAVAQEGGLVSVWTVSTGERTGTPVRHDGSVTDVIFSPDKKSLLSLDITGLGFEPRFGGLGGQGGPGRLGGEVRLPVVGGGLSGLGGFGGLAGLGGMGGGAPAPAPTNGYVRQWKPDKLDWPPGDARIVSPLPLHRLTQSATLSPDGLLALTVGSSQVAVWDFAQGRLAVPYLNCDEGVRAAWLSPDGHRLLTLTDSQARLWSLAGDNLPAPRLEHEASVQAVFSPDGAPQVATVSRRSRGSAQESEVRLWDATGQPAGPARMYGGEAYVTFTPAGPRVVTTGTEVKVWDATTGKQVASTMKHEGPASVLGFTGYDRQRLFTTVPGKGRSSSNVAAVYAWDLDKGELLYDPIRGDSRDIRSATLDGGLRFLVTVASWDEGKQTRSEVKVWDAATGRPVGKAIRLDSDCSYASVNQEGERVLTVTGNFFAWQWQLWDVVNGEALTKTQRLGDSRSRFMWWQPQFGWDGRTFVTWEGTEVSLREAASGGVVHVLHHRAPVWGARFSPDGHRLVTETAEGDVSSGDVGTAVHEVRIWDANTGEPVSPPIRNRSASGMASLDGEYFVLLKGTAFEVYHVGSGLPVTPLLAGSPVSFSANGRYLLYADENRPRVLNLFPEKHTPEKWADLARLLSNARLDRSDTAMPLETEESRGLWERFHTTAPEYFAATPEAQAGWHLHEAIRCERAQVWFGVAWHLERLGTMRSLSSEEQFRLGAARRALTLAKAYGWKEDWLTYLVLGEISGKEGRWEEAAGHYTKALQFQSAQQFEVFRKRGNAYGWLRKWKEALADYERSFQLYERDHQLTTKDEGDLFALALLRLQTGDLKGHEAACRAWLAALGKSPTSSQAQIVVWTSCLAPKCALDPKKAVELARAMSASDPKSYMHRKNLGAALYRDGQYAAALDTLQEANKLDPKGGTASNWLLLALVQHRLNHADEARTWLEKATREIDGLPPADWEVFIQLSLLRREAEEAIKGKPAPGK